MDFNSFIEDCLAKFLIRKQRVGFDQINSLINQGCQELDACKKILEISLKTAFTCAYNSMLYTARALMLLKGFRPMGTNQHKTVVEFIGMCWGQDYKALIEKFDNMRKKRNLAMYEPWKVNISKTDTQNSINSAEDFVGLVIKTIRENDPQHQFKFEQKER